MRVVYLRARIIITKKMVELKYQDQDSWIKRVGLKDLDVFTYM